MAHPVFRASRDRILLQASENPMVTVALWCQLLSVAVISSAAPTKLGPERQRIEVSDPAGTPYLAVLHGGQPDRAGCLRGARVALCSLFGQVIWDAYNATLNPWLLRAGRFAGQNVLLVATRRPTHFDPVERPRPYLYSLRPGARGLRKVWLGTSLSRPFVTLDFGDLDAAGEDELVALELTASRHLSVAAYRWEGFGIEGIAASDPFPDATFLRCDNAWGGPEEEAVVISAHGTLRRFVALQLREGSLLRVAEAAVDFGGGRVHWKILPPRNGPAGALRVWHDRFTRDIRFRAL